MRRDIILPKNPGWCYKHLTDSPAVMMPCVGCARPLHIHEVDIPHARKGRAPRYRCGHCDIVNVLVAGLSGNHVILAHWDQGAPAMQLEMKMGGVR